MVSEELIEQAADQLRAAEGIVALTGAGISAESGVPTFRGTQGLWEKFRPEELATPEAFAQHPDTVWRWYSERRRMCLECEPNAGHLALARLEAEHPGQVTVVSQTVDGLHRRAGSVNILAVHGSLFSTRCSRCEYAQEDDTSLYDGPPPCPECGSKLRPGVVWFGESLPLDVFDRAEQACIGADVVMVIGTSAMVQPVSSLPLMARHHGAFLVEVNPEATPLSSLVDVALPGPAGEVLGPLVEAALSG